MPLKPSLRVGRGSLASKANVGLRHVDEVIYVPTPHSTGTQSNALTAALGLRAG